VHDLIKEDLESIKKRFGNPRRTEITDAATDLEYEDLITEEMVAVTLSHEGYVKRMPLTTYRQQGRGGKGVRGADTKEGDFIEHLFTASTHDYLLFFTDQGKVYWRKVYTIPELGRTSRGRAIANVLTLDEGEKVASMVAVREFDGRNVIFATGRGVVKRTALDAFSHPHTYGIIAIGLAEGDQLIDARLTAGDQDMILSTRKGKAIRFAETDVRVMGRTARGVRGIRLRGGDCVVGMAIVDDTATLLTVCENGYGKRTVFEEYPRKKRGGQGVIDIKATKRNGEIVGALTVHDEDDVMMITAQGKVVRTPVAETRPIGRNTQGVTLINCDDDDRLVAVCRVAEEDIEDEPEAEEQGDEAETPEPAEVEQEPEAQGGDDEAGEPDGE
jgi:DNA gyrase subunit A